MMKRPYRLLTAALLLFPANVFADAGSTLREYKDASTLTPEKKPAEAIKYQDDGKAVVSEQAVAPQPMVHIEKIAVVGCQSALKIDPPSASKIDPPQAVVFS